MSERPATTERKGPFQWVAYSASVDGWGWLARGRTRRQAERRLDRKLNSLAGRLRWYTLR